MRSEMSNTRLACIGSGFMGEALIRGILAAGVYAPDEVCVMTSHRRANVLPA